MAGAWGVVCFVNLMGCLAVCLSFLPQTLKPSIVVFFVFFAKSKATRMQTQKGLAGRRMGCAILVVPVCFVFCLFHFCSMIPQTGANKCTPSSPSFVKRKSFPYLCLNELLHGIHLSRGQVSRVCLQMWRTGSPSSQQGVPTAVRGTQFEGIWRPTRSLKLGWPQMPRKKESCE